MGRSHRLLLLIVISTLAAGACSDAEEPVTTVTSAETTTTIGGDGDGTTSTTGTATSVPSTTTEATTTSMPDTTATTVPETTTTTAGPSGPCSGGAGVPLPAGASAITTATGDVDGDGAADTVAVYAAGSPSPWRTHLVLAYGYAVDVLLSEEQVARAIGAHDVNGGGEEIFAVVGAGAATTLVGVLTLVGCDLVRVADPAGFPAVFPVGATVGNQSGLACPGGGGVEVIRQSTADTVTYVRSTEELALSGAAFTTTGSSTETLTSPADDAEILAAASFDCGALALP